MLINYRKLLCHLLSGINNYFHDRKHQYLTDMAYRWFSQNSS